MEYSFDVNLAKKYSIEEAIVIKILQRVIAEDKANNENLYDGRTWVFNGEETWAFMFPFWTKNKIYYTFTKLTKRGILIDGSYEALARKSIIPCVAFKDESKWLNSKVG